MPEEQVYNEFATDTHRRVAGNLAQPRSAVDLARFLAKNDSYVVGGSDNDDQLGPDAHDPDQVEEYLEDLEADGLVKKIGPFDVPKAALKDAEGDEDLEDELAQAHAGQQLVAAIEKDKDIPTLPKDKAGHLLQRTANPERYPKANQEVQWCLTERGFERLQAPIRNEPPPLKGKALLAAKRQQRQLRKEERQLLRDERQRDVELRRQALKEAEEAAKKAAEEAGDDE